MNLYRVSYQYHERNAQSGDLLPGSKHRGTLSAAAIGVEEAIDKIRKHLRVPYAPPAMHATDKPVTRVAEIDVVTSVENCGKIDLM